MRVRVDQNADAVYLNLTDRPIKESEEVADGIVVDYDAKGKIVGVEILDASKLTGDPAVLQEFSFDVPGKGQKQSKIGTTRVQSSLMTAVRYDKGARLLDITFTSGKTYRYVDVPPGVHARLIKSDSKGEFFNDTIKGAYGFSELKRRA